MPSIMTALLREQIRLLKPLITNFSTETTRNIQEKLGELGAKAVANKVEFTQLDIGGVPAAYAVPFELEEGDSRVALYLHGGGYVAGSIKYASGFAGLLASKANISVLCVAYRLAPEHPFPAALEDSVAAYEHLLEGGVKPGDISLIGESAGGGLIFALCLELKRRGMELPARLVAISPWTDLTLSGGSIEENQKRDVCLSQKELYGFARAYAPDERENPLVSPVFGDLSGLPPCRIYVGGNEMLLDDSVKLAQRLKDAGGKCTLTVGEGLWHAYVLYGVPEGNEALAEIAAFFGEQ